MAQTCKVCARKDRKRIEGMYIHHPMREISQKTGISISALHRHKEHFRTALEKADIANGTSFRAKFDALVEDAAASLKKAKTDRDKIGWHGVLANWMNLAAKLGIEEARLREAQQTFSDVTPAVLKLIEEAKE